MLYLNNLIMYDRSSGESLWPQMARGARCGPLMGRGLAMLPALEITWEAWRRMHPATLVVSGSTGYSRDYRAYPYGTYDQPGHAELFFPIPDGIDTRRPPKERVLGLPIPGGGTAFLFGELLEAGPVATKSACWGCRCCFWLLRWSTDRGFLGFQRGVGAPQLVRSLRGDPSAVTAVTTRVPATHRRQQPVLPHEPEHTVLAHPDSLRPQAHSHLPVSLAQELAL